MNGSSLTNPPATGAVETNSGRTSRSTRRTTVHAPKISARSATPNANVTGQSETSVNPWSRSKFTRYALSDHFFAGSTSPVGTNHNPVSPFTVVVAGRVSASPDMVGWVDDPVWRDPAVEDVAAPLDGCV